MALSRFLCRSSILESNRMNLPSISVTRANSFNSCIALNESRRTLYTTANINPSNGAPSVRTPHSLKLAQNGNQKRWFHLHEYQNKNEMKKFGINIQKGKACGTPAEAYVIAKQLQKDGAKEFIVKSQILAGGRGKGILSSGLKGGVKVCSSPAEVMSYAEQMLGYRLKTKQTKADGEVVKQILVCEGVTIEKELYVAILLDRKLLGPAIVTSVQGGVDIEEVAAADPSAVNITPIDIYEGITNELGFKVAEQLGFETDHATYPMNVVDELKKMYKMFIERDCVQIEVNPFAVINGGKDVISIDAKVEYDDSAKDRQADLYALEDKSQYDLRELEAERIGVAFASLDGNIGCLVNGAGLGMATMDAIKVHGGEPANFLDGGGGTNAERVAECIELLHLDKKSKAIFVNIHGGIVFCDMIATGVINGIKKVAPAERLPVVIRICGSRMEEGKKLLNESGYNFPLYDDLEDAAIDVCQYVK